MTSLLELAQRFETPAFLEKDPSRFMHMYVPGDELCICPEAEVRDAEVIAFIAANLAFGRRDQILSHVQTIVDLITESGKTPAAWILDGDYKSYFEKKSGSFYRMYTFDHMVIFFDSIKRMLQEEKTLGLFFQKQWQKAVMQKGSDEGLYLHQIVAKAFPADCALISHGKDSAAKKINMMLRWLVRNNSPVDLGVWNWYSPARLLMPLDTHVMQQSVSFGFIKKTAAGKVPGANLKTALQLTEKMSEYFPDDPVRSDFALFGLGVNSKQSD